MTYSIRHQGSPRSVEGLTVAEVAEGLQDGQWEPDDEVKGPEDKEWVAIENHPKFEELAADLEPPLGRVEVDETRLDMNPVIDVALVLLVFFMLTASYAAIAQLAGNPKAVRAVGSACATNPMPVVVPCHRVVRSDGSMGGYLGGADAKRTLLALEAA